MKSNDNSKMAHFNVATRCELVEIRIFYGHICNLIAFLFITLEILRIYFNVEKLRE